MVTVTKGHKRPSITIKTDGGRLTPTNPVSVESLPVNSLETLADVDITGLANGDVLVYNANTDKFEAGTVSVGSVDEIDGGTF